MKALTLWRPWPWAIFHGGPNSKRIENRPWTYPEKMINQVIALHAGLQFDERALAFIANRVEKPFGANSPVFTPFEQSKHPIGVIGVATLRGWVESAAHADQFMTGQSVWFSGPFAWLLSDVRALPKPVPCKGFQKLWNLPTDVERQVLEQLAGQVQTKQATESA